ncbi:MAG: HDOD domain-containing protein [Gammaproteobacteria bacterium]|nr:HDOD domain-containing protein [Gammaproteobacteria bacterium]
MSTPAQALPILSPASRIAQALIDDLSPIVSPPDVVLKINDLLHDERAAIEDFAAVVIRDPGLTARLLRLVNSPYYGMSQRIETVSRAVMLVGMVELQKLVCSICAVQAFSRLSSAVTNMNSFWRHGVYTGLMSQAIARRLHVLHPERLFVAGLLHDIGTLLVNRRYPEIAEETIRASRGDEHLLQALEQQELGFDHALLGGLMLANWRLPATIADAIGYHHAPQEARQAPVDAAILHVAETIANFSGTGSFCEMVAPVGDFDRRALLALGLPADFDADALMDEVDRQFVETIYLLVT